jgi:hypothetical protein
MIERNYLYTVKRILINQNNVFNYNRITCRKVNIGIKSSFNTFGSEKNPKLSRLYNIFWYFINQKPLLKKIKFNYIKKKILKRIIFSANLSTSNSLNFLKYLNSLYLHFFHIYYQRTIKFNITNNSVVVYLDNPQLSFKNYVRRNQKVHLKVSFFFKKLNNQNLLIKYLANNFLIRSYKK